MDGREDGESRSTLPKVRAWEADTPASDQAIARLRLDCSLPRSTGGTNNG